MGRTNHQRQFGNYGVYVLVENITPAAQQSVPIFHGQGSAAAMVVFNRGQPDDLGDIFQRFQKNRPIADQTGVRQAIRSERVLIRQYQRGTGSAGSLHDSGQGKTAARIIDGIIRD